MFGTLGTDGVDLPMRGGDLATIVSVVGTIMDTTSMVDLLAPSSRTAIGTDITDHVPVD